MQLKIKSKGLFLAAVLLLCTSAQLFSYGGKMCIRDRNEGAAARL